VILRLLLVAALLLALNAESAAQPKVVRVEPHIGWVGTMEAAGITARLSDAPIIVYMYFANHAACQNFEDEVFVDKKFQELSALFVMVRVDAYTRKDVAEKFQVKRYPALVFLDSAGDKLYLLDSKLDARRVLSYMARAFLVSMYNSGRRAHDAGDVRTAVRRFETLLIVGEKTPPAAWARRELQRISAEGTKKLSQAKIALDGKDYLKAMTLLDELVYEYQGTDPGIEAKKLAEGLSKEPQAAEAMKEVTRRRDAQRKLARARKLEERKELEDALILYWDIARDFPDAPAAAEAARSANELARDHPLAIKAARRRMQRDCTQWMEIASAFELNGRKDKAIEYYQRIIDNYAGTSYAKKAREAIANLLGVVPGK